jgi:hypothetical protein
MKIECRVKNGVVYLRYRGFDVDSRIQDEDIKPPERPHALFQQLLSPSYGWGISIHRDSSAVAGGIDGIDDIISGLFVIEVVYDDAGTICGQSLYNSGTDATRGSGDYGDSPLEGSGHGKFDNSDMMDEEINRDPWPLYTSLRCTSLWVNDSDAAATTGNPFPPLTPLVSRS